VDFNYQVRMPQKRLVYYGDLARWSGVSGLGALCSVPKPESNTKQRAKQRDLYSELEFSLDYYTTPGILDSQYRLSLLIA